MAAAPVLTRGLNSWRAEINEVFPNRDKASDGWIGDLAHQNESSSGHNPDITGRAEYKDGDKLNEVRAVDIDSDLKNPKYSMEQLIQWLVTRARAGLYVPFRYFIYRRRIWARSSGWTTRAYAGPSPHDEHAHFSGDYNQKADEWTGRLGLAAAVTKATTSTPVKVKMIKINGSVPELRRGMKDPVPGVGSSYVKRVQAYLNWVLPGESPLKVDGDYGQATQDGVKLAMKDLKGKSSSDGSVVGLPEWNRIYAL
jgi:hypothetical protein